MIKLTAKNYKGVIHRARREWPKYSTQLMNIAAQNCKAFDKKSLGSCKELWLEMRSKGIRGTFKNWTDFYSNTPGYQNIPAAAQKIHNMLIKMQISGIDLPMCEDYVKEVILNKTHMGMGGEEMAIEAVANYFKKEFRFSNAEEESQGIDGWIDNKPAQVKPHGSVFKGHVHNHPDKDKILLITYEPKSQVCFIHNPEFLTKQN